MTGLTLDAGGLIALDRGERKMLVLLARAAENGDRITVPATALAQVLRSPCGRLESFVSAASPLPI